ncbi:hypothetical protein [Corticimicrobacter populi]|uniref:Uncharacterized protein n=1 Tax=Corticimicrobacter populi TaxID=2175229 RepID=A0A2V1K624_9BURK|nr:hypothetical protein [Corticimicrobacter populi]PWF25027.1 hypothetical protein DD235_02315 [Corticimicrobacter populi]
MRIAAALLDDLYRTAPPGDAPGEWPATPEPEVLSPSAAASGFALALAENRDAFGMSASDAADCMLNILAADDDLLNDAFAVLLEPGLYPARADQIRRRLADWCSAIANEHQETQP